MVFRCYKTSFCKNKNEMSPSLPTQSVAHMITHTYTYTQKITNELIDLNSTDLTWWQKIEDNLNKDQNVHKI